MNEILKWLSDGDLRSDGVSNEVVEFILDNPELIDELFDGLNSPNAVIRGRTADALEKVGREKPELFKSRLSKLLQIAENDEVAMVKMHLAMLLGHLVVLDDRTNDIRSALFDLLDDDSAFTKGWAIVSLCIIAKRYPEESQKIVEKIAKYQDDESIAIRTRVRKAIELLGEEESQFAKGWLKSKHYRDM